ncbi:hypothetical protein LCGC14_2634470 [marine sediment metagenome]|uniref:ABC transmembrane type-1 domain-containing protein n=1 Tax=marine sediment metagenome TaxID=412755 RepID=A0A0F8ZZG5_9ZZZZ
MKIMVGLVVLIFVLTLFLILDFTDVFVNGKIKIYFKELRGIDYLFLGNHGIPLRTVWRDISFALLISLLIGAIPLSVLLVVTEAKKGK